MLVHTDKNSDVVQDGRNFKQKKRAFVKGDFVFQVIVEFYALFADSLCVFFVSVIFS